MYDIVLNWTAREVVPDFQEFYAQHGNAVDSVKLENFFVEPKRTGFLGQQLTAPVAQDLLFFLLKAGASAQRIPAVYQHPQITQEEAQTLAEQELQAIQARAYPEEILGPIQFVSEHFLYWQFKSTSRRKEVFVSIDKLNEYERRNNDVAYFSEEASLLEKAITRARLQSLGSPIFRWPSQFTTYDLYFFQECKTLPFLDDLSEQLGIPLAELQEKVMRKGPGFRGLDLSYTFTDEFTDPLLLRAAANGARGCRMPSEYRQPCISIEEAQMIADEVVQEYHIPGFTVDLPTHHEPMWEHPWHWYWFFCTRFRPIVDDEEGWNAFKETFQEGGGWANAYIDKLDGHNWTLEERYYLQGESWMLSCLHDHPDLHRFFL